MRLRIATAALACALLLAACGGDRDGGTAGPASGTDATLPAPARNEGPVTGMPDGRGPGDVPIGGEPPPPEPGLLPAEQFGLPSTLDNPEAGFDGSDPAAEGEPTVADAEATLDGY